MWNSNEKNQSIQKNQIQKFEEQLVTRDSVVI